MHSAIYDRRVSQVFRSALANCRDSARYQNAIHGIWHGAKVICLIESYTEFFLSTLFCLRPRESQASCRGMLLDMQNNKKMFTLCHDHNPF